MLHKLGCPGTFSRLSFPLDQWFSTRATGSPRDTGESLKIFLHCQNCGEKGVATGIYKTEARDATKHLPGYRRPHHKDSSSPKLE